MTSPDNQASESPSVEGPGQRLRTAREGMGLSTRDIASRLRLDVKHIEAIEHNEYNGIMAPVFVRGYLRSYARLVNLPPDTVLRHYDSGQSNSPQVLHSKLTSVTANSSERTLSWVIYLLVLTAAIVAVVWWQVRGDLTFGNKAPLAGIEQYLNAQQDKVAASPASAPARPEVTVAGTQQVSTPVAAGETASAATITPSPSAVPATPRTPATVPIPPSAQTAAASPADQAAGSAERPVVATAAPAKADSASTKLVLRFTADSWVEITDANNTRILYDLVPAGVSKTLDAVTPPIHVVLGNAPAVTVEYNGQTFDHSRYNRVGVARFVLGPAASDATQ